MVNDEDRNRWKARLNKLFNDSKTQILESHTFWFAQSYVYKSYQITKLMKGPLNDMGACEEEREQLDEFLSKKLKLPFNKVHPFLAKKTNEKAAELLLNYTGGNYARALDKLDESASQDWIAHNLSREQNNYCADHIH